MGRGVRSGHPFGAKVFEKGQIVGRCEAIGRVVLSRPVVSDSVTTNLIIYEKYLEISIC